MADLTPDEVFQMEVDDRIELLKSNILHYTRHLLNFDVSRFGCSTRRREAGSVAVAWASTPDAAQRSLCTPARGQRRHRLRCRDRQELSVRRHERRPPLHRRLQRAKSSLTVPLIWNDQVIGTFNVESPEPRGFTESDLQFLEIFLANVAVALNTLELLVAQKANAAQESVEAIHSAVALPVDEILNDAVNVMERYIGHEPEVVERLQDILRHARDIKQIIQKIGQKMAPAEAVPATAQIESGRSWRTGACWWSMPMSRFATTRTNTRPLWVRRRNGPRGQRSHVDGATSHGV